MIPFWLVLMAALAAQPRNHAVRGTVIDGTTHTPIFGAVIAGSDGKRLAVTDRRGRFDLKVDLPASVQVSAPRLATRTVAVPAAQDDIDLGRVLLWRSARVRVAMPSLLSSEHVEWSLRRGEPGAKNLEEVRHGTVPQRHPQFSIEDVEPAHYVLTFRGEGPLQQYATPLNLEAGSDLIVPLTISPFVVDLDVTSGDTPVPEATVRFEHAAFLWSATVVCNDLGKASVEAWQSGKFWLFAQIHGQIVDGRIETLPEGREHVPIQVLVAAHTIHGHVLESAAGTPIKDANIAIEIAGKGVRTAHSNAAGDFEFEAVGEGQHVLRVYKKGYRINRPYRVEVNADDGDVEKTISIDPETATRSVRLVDRNGAPVAGANIFFGAGAAVQPLESTDQTGSVDVPEGTGVLFAVPPGGSFAFRTIRADETGSIAMNVPPGTGLITITSESTKHEPIPYVMFLLRVDGTLLPPAVVSRLATTQRLPFRTDADGRAQLGGLPSGRYDIWPIRARNDLDAILSGAASAPAATVLVAATPQNVTLTFEPVRK
jgi:carboxypeptidase family protein